MPTLPSSGFHPWSCGLSLIRRTAVCGPACTVVWQGRKGDLPPYADCVPSRVDSWEVQVLCAGINRHEVENVRVLRERISDLLGPEFCTRRREAFSEA